MKNFTCTFTGVDTYTSLKNLTRISKLYPFVEWGILLSTSDKKSFHDFRYPSVDWLEETLPKIQKISQETGCTIAFHVCGAETKKLLTRAPDSVALKLIKYVNRVQVNFAYKESQVQQLESLCVDFPNINFITQHNHANFDLYQKTKSTNHQILFDTSGGRGIENTTWISALNEKTFGYAGGLSIHNIQSQLTNILALNNVSFWIDSEGHLRTEGKLDLAICEQFLQTCNSLIK